MAALFSTPKMPKVRQPDPPPPPPERTDDETAALAADQRKKYTGGGRAFTMLTGGQGAGTGMSAMRYLGGSART